MRSARSSGKDASAERLGRHVTDPRALAAIFERAEAELAKTQHPDPYRRE